MNLRDFYKFTAQDSANAVIFTPTVDQRGVISWSNNAGLENPADVNIMGPDGKSAYQIWLSLGNSGSEADFIASLRGPDGKSAYQSWLEAGNSGSEADFVASLVGPAGKSAYQSWLDAGNIGSEATFVESLKGEPGKQGPVGKSTYQIWLELGNSGTPEDFIASLRGATGASAYEVWLANGNEGSEIDFLNSLKGKDGGKGGYLVWLDVSDVNEDGYYWDYPIPGTPTYSLMLKRPVSDQALFIDLEGALAEDFSSKIVSFSSANEEDRKAVQVFNGASWIDHPEHGMGAPFNEQPVKILLAKFAEFGSSYFLRYRWNIPTRRVTTNWVSIAIPSYTGIEKEENV